MRPTFESRMRQHQQHPALLWLSMDSKKCLPMSIASGPEASRAWSLAGSQLPWSLRVQLPELNGEDGEESEE